MYNRRAATVVRFPPKRGGSITSAAVRSLVGAQRGERPECLPVVRGTGIPSRGRGQRVVGVLGGHLQPKPG
eukprot:6823242-Pyramimonas_sp.AAC.1